MEMKDHTFDLYSISSNKKEEGQIGKGINSNNSTDSSVDPKSLAKLIIPPLGASDSYNYQNVCNGRIISPMSSRYRCWETVMVILVAYSAWIVPFEIAFLDSNTSTPLFFADNIVDMFFAVDIVLTFFVAFIDPTTQLPVRDSRKIATR